MIIESKRYLDPKNSGPVHYESCRRRSSDDHQLERTDLTGWIPIVTPFSSDGALDTCRRTVGGRAVGRQRTASSALGTTGEAATLTLEVEPRWSRSATPHVDAGRPRLMVGVGTNFAPRRQRAELTQLMSVGEVAAALMVVVPYAHPAIRGGRPLRLGRRSVSRAGGALQRALPYRTGVGRCCAAEAARHPNIAGLKQAVGAVDVVTLEVLAGSGAEFAVLAGDDAFIAPMMALGAQGAIAAAAHACTRLFAQLVAQAPGGNETVGSPGVRALAQALLPVRHREVGFDAAAIRRCGRVAGLRAPSSRPRCGVR
ncbi:MAG: dihydrodipicolinate synthase family protein [Acidimicrobiales bacterium]